MEEYWGRIGSNTRRPAAAERAARAAAAAEGLPSATTGTSAGAGHAGAAPRSPAQLRARPRSAATSASRAQRSPSRAGVSSPSVGGGGVQPPAPARLLSAAQSASSFAMRSVATSGSLLSGGSGGRRPLLDDAEERRMRFLAMSTMKGADMAIAASKSNQTLLSLMRGQSAAASRSSAGSAGGADSSAADVDADVSSMSGYRFSAADIAVQAARRRLMRSRMRRTESIRALAEARSEGRLNSRMEAMQRPPSPGDISLTNSTEPTPRVPVDRQLQEQPARGGSTVAGGLLQPSALSMRLGAAGRKMLRARDDVRGAYFVELPPDEDDTGADDAREPLSARSTHSLTAEHERRVADMAADAVGRTPPGSVPRPRVLGTDLYCTCQYPSYECAMGMCLRARMQFEADAIAHEEEARALELGHHGGPSDIDVDPHASDASPGAAGSGPALKRMSSNALSRSRASVERVIPSLNQRFSERSIEQLKRMGIDPDALMSMSSNDERSGAALHEHASAPSSIVGGSGTFVRVNPRAGVETMTAAAWDSRLGTSGARRVASSDALFGTVEPHPTGGASGAGRGAQPSIRAVATVVGALQAAQRQAQAAHPPPQPSFYQRARQAFKEAGPAASAHTLQMRSMSASLERLHRTRAEEEAEFRRQVQRYDQQTEAECASEVARIRAELGDTAADLYLHKRRQDDAAQRTLRELRAQQKRLDYERRMARRDHMRVFGDQSAGDREYELRRRFSSFVVEVEGDAEAK